MFLILKHTIAALLIAALSVTCVNAQQTKSSPPEEFMSLYYDFTGSSNKNYPKGNSNISQDLYKSTMSELNVNENEQGPLVLFLDSNFYIYDNQGKQLLSMVLRTSPSSGFFEMTAISHVGPALAYLVYMKENGSKEWIKGLQNLKRDLKAIKKLNANKTNNWTQNIDAPSWTPYLKSINDMVDYACSMAGNYIDDVLKGKKEFTMDSLNQDFLTGNKDYPIAYNNIMIGTFMLTALDGLMKVHGEVSKLDIDWAKAKVLIRNVAGTNITSALSESSNWLVPLTQLLSNNKINKDRIFIAPYAKVKKSVGKEKLSSEDFTYYNYAWSRTYNRTHIASKVFSNIPDILSSKPKPIPGDYAFSKATDINDFIIRLKYSLSQPTEMLSNTVTFWLIGELSAKKWDLSKIDIPGFTTGFPNNITKYPSNNPEIG